MPPNDPPNCDASFDTRLASVRQVFDELDRDDEIAGSDEREHIDASTDPNEEIDRVPKTPPPRSPHVLPSSDLGAPIPCSQRRNLISDDDRSVAQQRETRPTLDDSQRRSSQSHVIVSKARATASVHCPAPDCEYWGFVPRTITRHYQQTHGGTLDFQWTCSEPGCNQVSCSQQKIWDHEQEQHNLPCFGTPPLHPSDVPTGTRILDYRVPTNASRFPCPFTDQCSHSSARCDVLTKHVETIHNVTIRQVWLRPRPYCPYETTEKRIVMKHVKYECRARDTGSNPIVEPPPAQPDTCPGCRLETGSSIELRKHMRIHPGLTNLESGRLFGPLSEQDQMLVEQAIGDVGYEIVDVVHYLRLHRTWRSPARIQEAVRKVASRPLNQRFPHMKVPQNDTTRSITEVNFSFWPIVHGTRRTERTTLTPTTKKPQRHPTHTNKENRDQAEKLIDAIVRRHLVRDSDSWDTVERKDAGLRDALWQCIQELTSPQSQRGEEQGERALRAQDTERDITAELRDPRLPRREQRRLLRQRAEQRQENGSLYFQRKYQHRPKQVFEELTDKPRSPPCPIPCTSLEETFRTRYAEDQNGTLPPLSPRTTQEATEISQTEIPEEVVPETQEICHTAPAPNEAGEVDRVTDENSTEEQDRGWRLREPTIESVETRLSALNQTSSAGPDGITYAIWKLFPSLTTWLEAIFRKCFQEARIPAQWRISKTILLLKKPTADPLDIGNWRPVSLITVGRRTQSESYT
ncbi:uncharacterized protein VTP21DRAFT_6910 [Calcarisporiella thermophila]|uniref:uncharacterized protein n=1 Tax=Calcarisporiella thermophila TaxID=911321 RepID=UPI00374363BD